MIHKISLDGDQFQPMKLELERYLQNTINTMHEKGANGGSVTAKIDISLDSVEENGKITCYPLFETKVSTAVHWKANAVSKINADRQLELIYSPGSGYIMIPVGGQMELDDFAEEGDGFE